MDFLSNKNDNILGIHFKYDISSHIRRTDFTGYQVPIFPRIFPSIELCAFVVETQQDLMKDGHFDSFLRFTSAHY